MKRITSNFLKTGANISPTASAHPLAAVNQATPINVVDVLPDGFREAGWREVRNTLIGNMRIILLEKQNFHIKGLVFCDSNRHWVASALLSDSNLSLSVYSYRIRGGVSEREVANWFHSIIQACKLPVFVTVSGISASMMALAMLLCFLGVASGDGIGNVFAYSSLPFMFFAFFPELILERFFTKEEQAVGLVYKEIEASVAKHQEEQEAATTLGSCL